MASDPFLAILAEDDPWPRLHDLRRKAPVHFVAQGGFWFVTRHDDVMCLLHNPEHVGLDGRIWDQYVPSAEGSLSRWSEDHGLFTLAPENHARIRRSVAAAFTPQAVRRMELHIQGVVDRFASPLMGRQGSTVDFVAEFSGIIPTAVIGRLAGISEVDEPRFLRLVHSLVTGFLPFAPPELRKERENSFAELFAWIRELIASRRMHPKEDLLTALILPLSGHEALSENDVVLLLTSIIGAGGETTASAASALIKAVLENPTAMEALRADRSLIYRCVDELIRFSTGATSGPVRYAKCDFDLRGKRIRKGQMILLSRGGACRDPEIYPEPDTLDLHRDVHLSLAFGHGPHYCLGASLARWELACMLDAVLDIVPPGSRIRMDKLEFRNEGLFRRRLNLPVEIAVDQIPTR